MEKHIIILHFVPIVCIKSLKKHKNIKVEEQVNLFMAGDRLQSIYNPKAINWRSQDIGLAKFKSKKY